MDLFLKIILCASIILSLSGCKKTKDGLADTSSIKNIFKKEIKPKEYFEEAEFLGQEINKLQKYIGTPFVNQEKWKSCESGKTCTWYHQSHGGYSCFMNSWGAGTVEGKVELINREYYSRCGIDKYPTALKLLKDYKPDAILITPNAPKIDLGNQVGIYYAMGNAMAAVTAICPQKPHDGSGKVKISFCVIARVKTFLCGPQYSTKECKFTWPEYKSGQYDLDFDI
ncbi:MAG: hypothetical protein K2Q26_03960 [Bdellovibrionales bacterium]|nr:hypothetical protein [Bdellovibrionales bacterium]